VILPGKLGKVDNDLTQRDVVFPTALSTQLLGILDCHGGVRERAEDEEGGS